MGQYYSPCALNKSKTNVEGYIYSHDIKSRFKRQDGKVFMMGEGLKLMEHSYINNKLMRCVEGLLVPGGAWNNKPIVWAGDYAENEKDTDQNFNSMCRSVIEGEHISNKIIPKPLSIANSKKHRFIINHTTKEFVDKECVQKDNDGYKIHPLSLLTAEGNGSGGGDFFGKDPKHLVGSWARHIISMEKVCPKIEGYKELIFNINE